MSYKVPTFQFFSDDFQWQKPELEGLFKQEKTRFFGYSLSKIQPWGWGTRNEIFARFSSHFSRGQFYYISNGWSSSNKCDRKTILDDYWVEILAGKCLRCPNRLAKGFTGTKNLFNTFLSSIRRYKLPNKKTRESVQKLKLQICYSMKSVMINQKRFLIWRLSCLK